MKSTSSTISKPKKMFTIGKTHNIFFPYVVRFKETDVANCATKQYAQLIKNLLKEANLRIVYAKKKG